MKKTILILSLIITFFGLINSSWAQNESVFLFVTWRADTFIPEEYQGKGLVSPGATITYSVEAIYNQQLLSLKDKMIRWYAQDHLAQSGIGLQTFSAQAKLLAGNDFKIRVEVLDLPGGTISKTVKLKIVQPKVAIQALLPNLKTAIADFSIRAVPYFFSVSTENDLSYKWLINNSVVSGEGDPQIFTVSKDNLIASEIRSFTFKVLAQNNKLYLDKGSGIKTIDVIGDSR